MQEQKIGTILWRGKWLMAISLAVCVALAVFVTKTSAKVYAANAIIQVNAPSQSTTDTPPVPGEGWNLNRIERLVEQYAGAYPTRLDEWRYYLLYLREFAEIGGALPRSFDWLVWDAFGDLLQEVPAEASV